MMDFAQEENKILLILDPFLHTEALLLPGIEFSRGGL